jgi:hypothetical protein
MRTTDNAENLDQGAIRTCSRVRRHDARPAGARRRVHRGARGVDPARHDWQWYPRRPGVVLRRGVRGGAADAAGVRADRPLLGHHAEGQDLVRLRRRPGVGRQGRRPLPAPAVARARVAERDGRGDARAARVGARLWPRVPHRLLVENTANGPDAIAQMRREVDGVYPVTVRGRQGAARPRRVAGARDGPLLAAGVRRPEPGREGLRPVGTPADVQAFVEEAAMFRGDMKHAHDDQVDAWSQMVNWTRSAAVRRPSRLTQAVGPKLPTPTLLPGY